MDSLVNDKEQDNIKGGQIQKKREWLNQWLIGKWGKRFGGGLFVLVVVAGLVLSKYLNDKMVFTPDNMARDLVMKAGLTPAIGMKVTAYGSLVAVGDSQNYEVIVFPRKNDKEMASDLMSFVFDFYIKYVKPDGNLYEMTMKNGRAFYSISNGTTGALKVRQCLKNEDVLKLGEFADVMANAKVILDAPVDLNYIMECPNENDGKLVHGKWEHREYVYCVQSESGTGDRIISRISGEQLLVDVTYWNETKALEARETYLKPFPKTLVNIWNQPTECDELNLMSSTDRFDVDSFLDQHNAGKKTEGKGARQVSAWFHSPNKLVNHPVRKLQSGRKLQAVTYDNFWDRWSKEEQESFFINIQLFECTHFCFPDDNTAFPIGELGSFFDFMSGGVSFRQRSRHLKGSKRKLSSDETITVTLPRDCIFFAGSGYHGGNVVSSAIRDGYTPERTTDDDLSFFHYKLEYSTSTNPDSPSFVGHWGDRIGVFPAHLGWGEMFSAPLCYCKTSKTVFATIDTYTRSWFDSRTQNDMVALTNLVKNHWTFTQTTMNNRSLLYRLRQIWRAWLDNKTVPVIENTIIFTHYTSSLTMGASMANNLIVLGESSRWITIHAPVLGIEYLGPDEDIAALLCTREHIEELILAMGVNDEMVTETYEQLGGQHLSGGMTLVDIINACSPHHYNTINGTILNLEWITNLNPLTFPENVSLEFEKAQEQMALRVDAAMCGSSVVSYLKPKSILNQVTSDLGMGGNGISDGILPLFSCLGLEKLKKESGINMTWSTDSHDPFVISNNHNTDGEDYADALLDGTAFQRSFMEHKRFHIDGGGGSLEDGIIMDEEDDGGEAAQAGLTSDPEESTRVDEEAAPDPSGLLQEGEECGGGKDYEGPTDCQEDLTCKKKKGSKIHMCS